MVHVLVKTIFLFLVCVCVLRISSDAFYWLHKPFEHCLLQNLQAEVIQSLISKKFLLVFD